MHFRSANPRLHTPNSISPAILGAKESFYFFQVHRKFETAGDEGFLCVQPLHPASQQGGKPALCWWWMRWRCRSPTWCWVLLGATCPFLAFSEGNSQILTCQLPQKNSWSVACTCWMLMIGLENISGFSVGSHSSMQEETCGSGVRLIHLSGSQCSMGWKGEELLCRGGSSSPWKSIGFGSQWLDMLSPCTMSLPCASVLPAHCLGLIPDVHK